MDNVAYATLKEDPRRTATESLTITGSLNNTLETIKRLRGQCADIKSELYDRTGVLLTGEEPRTKTCSTDNQPCAPGLVPEIQSELNALSNHIDNIGALMQRI